MNNEFAPTKRSRYRGCLLGGAVGDALGAPVEFMSRAAILDRYGPGGLTDYAPAYGRRGAITDDTQMTLFTAEGLLRGHVRLALKGVSHVPSVVAHAYLRWLRTQGVRNEHDVGFGDDEPGWLFGHAELHDRRGPGNTCLGALVKLKALGEPAHNDSKGCGGVMRVAPVGLFAAAGSSAPALDRTFDGGVEIAALTHGHPSGSLTAGVLSVMIVEIVRGLSIVESLDAAVALLRPRRHAAETIDALAQARTLARTDLPAHEAIARLGQGWVAEEALAIAVYCALTAKDFREAVCAAVNHDGDSDSTGAITGNLLGALWGERAIPTRWLDELELRAVIGEVADDLLDFPRWQIGEYGPVADHDRIWARYPGF